MPGKRKIYPNNRRVIMVPVQAQRGGLALSTVAGTVVPVLRKTKAISRGSRALQKQNIPVISPIAGVVGDISSALGFGMPVKRRTYRRRR